MGMLSILNARTDLFSKTRSPTKSEGEGHSFLIPRMNFVVSSASRDVPLENVAQQNSVSTHRGEVEAGSASIVEEKWASYLWVELFQFLDNSFLSGSLFSHLQRKTPPDEWFLCFHFVSQSNFTPLSLFIFKSQALVSPPSCVNCHLYFGSASLPWIPFAPSSLLIRLLSILL